MIKDAIDTIITYKTTINTNDIDQKNTIHFLSFFIRKKSPRQFNPNPKPFRNPNPKPFRNPNPKPFRNPNPKPFLTANTTTKKLIYIGRNVTSNEDDETVTSNEDDETIPLLMRMMMKELLMKLNILLLLLTTMISL